MEDLEQEQAPGSTTTGQEASMRRAVFLGACVVVLVSVWATYSEFIVRSSRLNMSTFPIALFVPFLLLALVLNPLLRRLMPKFALSRSELLLILMMGWVSGVIPAADGLPGYLLGIIAAPYYFATPENGWTQYLHPHIPAWIAPSNSTRAMEWFFEGLPPGQSIPWGEWIVPLFWWLSFIAVVAMVSICMAVILRRQWAQNERLVYPLATTAMELASEPQSGHALPAFMRQTLFWIGFSVGFVMIAWNILAYFWPGVPIFPTGENWSGTWLYLGNEFPGIRLKLNLYTVGFVYLTNLEILFSVWFFYVLNVFQIGLFNRMGFSLKKSIGWGSSDEISGWEGFGALTMWVIWGMWISRVHLRRVFSCAFGSVDTEEGSEELMKYRTAGRATLLGVLYILLWLHASGMEYRMAAVITVGIFISYIGVSKIIAETGLLYVRTPLSGQSLAVYTLGSRTIASSSLTSMAFSFALISYRGLFLPPLVHAARLSDFIRVKKRTLLHSVIFSLSLSALVSITVTLYLAYGHGAYNFDVFPYSAGNKRAFDAAVSVMKGASGTSWERMSLFCVGAGLMAVLGVLRYRLHWWPVHPIGLTIAGTNFTRELAFSAFLIWGLKGILLKVGGVTLYGKGRVFFLGLLTGYALSVALSFLVDMVWFLGNGHVVHTF